MIKSLLILVVLYKTTIENSETLQSLLKARRAGFSIDIVIWDNSPLDFAQVQSSTLLDRLRALGDTVSYLRCVENRALSKLYNEVIRDYPASKYVVLFDQDSVLPEVYFDLLERQLSNFNNVDLFLPVVRSGNVIVSPGAYRWIKGSYWRKKREGVVKSKRIVAITSGMVISQSYLTQYYPAFDERLTLYGIDTAFMLRYARRRSSLVVMDIEIGHNSFLLSRPNASEFLSRFRNLKAAWRVIHSDSVSRTIAVRLYIFYLNLKHAIKYKKLDFLL